MFLGGQVRAMGVHWVNGSPRGVVWRRLLDPGNSNYCNAWVAKGVPKNFKVSVAGKGVNQWVKLTIHLTVIILLTLCRPTINM